MAELKRLIARRGILKGQLTRFNNYLNNFTDNLDSIIQMQARLESFSSILSDFNNIQLEIECADENNEFSEENSIERENFESRYFDLISRSKIILSQEQSEQNVRPITTTHNSSSDINNQFNVKLPQVNLPEFNGQYDKWTQFHDTFDALINKNPALSNIQRFYYLQGCLKGEAISVISSLIISDVNYIEAWKLLVDRYENKKAIIHSHLKSIFELPVINKESHASLRNFLDNFLKHFRSLKNLQENVETWDTILIYLLTSKLDEITRREWEILTKDNTSPKVNEFIHFLAQRCQLLESIDTKINTNNAVTKKPTSFKSHAHVTTNNTNCPLCNSNHFIYQCKKFIDLPVQTRYTEAKRLNLCTNCLRRGHSNSECKSTSCRDCNKRHNSLLHLTSNAADSHNTNTENNLAKSRNIHTESRNNESNSRTNDSNSRNNKSESRNNHANSNSQSSNHANQSSNHANDSLHAQSSSHCSLNANYNQQTLNSLVLLSTAIINVYDSNKCPIKCRVLLDNGSQSNFVTRKFVTRLGLKTTKINIPVLGINQSKTSITSQTNIKIKSMYNQYQANLSFLIIDNITDLTPQETFDISHLNIPETIKLADPEFNKSASIDMLLGVNIFFDLLCVGQIKLGRGLPILHKTKLGWIISGQMLENKTNRIQSCFLSVNADIHNQIERFWKIEENYPQIKHSKEETECEEHFSNNTYRDSSGRFVVKLPLRRNCANLGDSLDNATKRFLSIEQKLNRNPDLKQSYCNFMSEYQSLGHMTKINHDDVSHIPHYYLPHHCVEKHDSLTTKLRVVFDASAKTTTGMSLNDILKIGPNVQSDLFSILLRFRKHAVVMIGDIAKMYRQVLIDPSQRNLQLIVWRDNPESELNHFQLNTVTYGTASAAFLATRCLKQISLDNSADYPVESKIISNDFYVDDLLTGSHDESSLITIHQNLVKLLSQAGFDLRKFTSNSATVLHKIKNNSDNSVSKNLNYIITDNQSTKTLGVSWNPILDQFEYNSQITLQICNVSKRTILSLISQIFDPLGLLGPIIIQAKIILQKLWQLQLGWDESIPIDLFTIWQQFYKQLGKVDSIHIPRHIIIPNSVNVQLHGFCDSSERAYGACLYIRSENREGHIQVRLLCAKSRVAPLKVISLPRLELCAAVLLTQLANKVINALDMTIDKIFYWTDSSIVLSWLSAEPYTWQTFVSNRVSEIQQSSQIDEWYHVKSCNNPADIISRGINPTEITQCKLWWQGPEYLSQIKESWPKHAHISNYSRRDSEIPERRNQSKNVLTCTNTFDIFDKFSKLSRLQNVFAYCLRFIKNCRSNRDTRIIGPLTHQEISNSSQILVKLAQSQSFAEDIQSLKKSNRVRPNSKLSSLSPFLDKNNLIRVGGRLKNSNLVYNQKHQVLLPSKHPLTRLIIQDYHTRNLHAGVQTTLSFVRQVYWPINGKSEVKSILRKCIACFKARPLSINQQMGELPQNRITPCRIFSRCGVDYAGPVYIKDGKTRNRKIIKAYICVFICMTSKAIHLELVSELSTEMFLNALKRFVARRGLCTHIYSDNATNFTGANNELLEVNNILEQSSFQNYLRDQKIQWHFIPARSPNFGGLWEAAVKAVKHHLKRVLNNINLTYEEYYTFLTQIEAVLNSRPICPISQDPNDLEALTPGHFIIGDALNAIPEQNVENVSSNRLTRYQHIRQMVEHFWNRWKTEYLHNLQQRHKWKFQQNPQALIGSLVLLKDENSPPLHWPKARIVEVHPGADGLVRVVSVKTINGVVKRALGKICILPI